MAGINRRSGNVGVSNVRSSAASNRTVSSNVLNQNMSRSGFVKTVGLGAAALTGVATAKGGAARAQTVRPPIVIYPTGVPEGPNSDTDIIQNAVDAASDGDVIILKSVNSAGVPTSWYLAKTWTPDAPVVLMRGATGTYDYYRDLEGNPWPPEMRINYQVIGVDSKQLTFKGDSDGKTEIKYAEDQEAYLTALTQFYTDYSMTNISGAGFLLAGPKTIRFEGLTFKYNSWSPIWAYAAPFEVVNCKFDYCDNPINSDFDNRYPGRCLVSGCSFANYTYGAIFFWGGKITIEGCHFAGTDFDMPGASLLAIINGIALWDELILYIPDGTNVGLFDLHRLEDVHVKGCAFDFTGSHIQPRRAVSVARSLGGIINDVSVEKCAFTNVAPMLYCIEAAVTFDVGTGPAFATSCSAVGNSFIGCSGPLGIIFAGGTTWTSRPSNCLVSNNTFVNCDGPAVYFNTTNNCQSMNNDYAQSRLPGWSVGNGCVLLDTLVTNSTITEHNFPAATDHCDQILDLPDFDSSIEGLYTGCGIAMVDGKPACYLSWDMVQLIEGDDNSWYYLAGHYSPSPTGGPYRWDDNAWAYINVGDSLGDTVWVQDCTKVPKNNTIWFPGYPNGQCGKPSVKVIQRLQQLRELHKQKMQMLGDKLEGMLGRRPGRFGR